MDEFIFGFFVGWCVFGLLATYAEARWSLLTRIVERIRPRAQTTIRRPAVFAGPATRRKDCPTCGSDTLAEAVNHLTELEAERAEWEAKHTLEYAARGEAEERAQRLSALARELYEVAKGSRGVRPYLDEERKAAIARYEQEVGDE